MELKLEPSIEHLYIYTHGVCGNAKQGEPLKKLIEQKDPKSYVHLAVSNESFFLSLSKTMDGIESGGRRLRAETESILAQNGHIKYISFIGKSFGGLYCRYVGATVDYNKYNVEPFHFVTLATPHLGLHGKDTWLHTVLRCSGSVFGNTARSLRELYLYNDTIHQMAEDDKISSLKLFKHRWACATVDENDTFVTYQSASLDFSALPPEQRLSRMASSLNDVSWNIVRTKISHAAYDNVEFCEHLVNQIYSPEPNPHMIFPAIQEKEVIKAEDKNTIE